MSSQQPKPASNGTSNGTSRRAPPDQLEIYDSIVNPETTDEISGHLGSGFYTEDEQWQQVRSYLKGMYGDAAFGRRLYERAVNETIYQLGLHGWRWWDDNREQYTERDGVDPEDDVGPRESPRTKIRERGEKIWELLKAVTDEHGAPQRLLAMQEYAGIEGDWMPPHWRMMETRHEASKSREARTQDNVFGTRQHRSFEEDGETAGGKRRFGGRFRRSRGGGR